MEATCVQGLVKDNKCTDHKSKGQLSYVVSNIIFIVWVSPLLLWEQNEKMFQSVLRTTNFHNLLGTAIIFIFSVEL